MINPTTRETSFLRARFDQFWSRSEVKISAFYG
jgi:hypothetical protein